MADTAAISRRVPELDGLRGIAIGLVILHHFFVPLLGFVPGSPGAYLGASLALSFTGVDLFFVLSGYLIGGILMDHRDSPQLFSAFYIRRAARILPLAFGCIGVILVAYAAGLYAPFEGRAPWPASVYLLFAVNFWMAAAGSWGFLPLAPLWSLAIEEQFYLVAPLLIRFVRPARVVWLLALFAATAVLARLGILASDPGATITASLLPFCRLDCLSAGMFAAWVVRHPATCAWCTQHRFALGLVWVSAAASCALLTKLRASNAGFAMAAGGYTIVAVFYASLLVLVETRRHTAINRLLAFAPLTLLGRYAYFLYLFQGVVIGLSIGLIFHRRLAILEPETWWQLGTGLAVLMTAAHLSWRWFESPLLALGRRRAY